MCGLGVQQPGAGCSGAGFQQHSLCKELWGFSGAELEVEKGPASAGYAPQSVPAVVSTGKHMAAWDIYIHFVWGDMFYMPVLPVIGQTFTLGFQEALGKQERASMLAGRL